MVAELGGGWGAGVVSARLQWVEYGQASPAVDRRLYLGGPDRDHVKEMARSLCKAL
jgi:hypothetical protein